MNLSKAVKLNLALAGLGAFLFVVPAYPQQEVDPDHFSATGVEAFHESPKAIAAHPGKLMLASVTKKSAKTKMVAGYRRNPARVTSAANLHRAAAPKRVAKDERE